MNHTMQSLLTIATLGLASVVACGGDADPVAADSVEDFGGQGGSDGGTTGAGGQSPQGDTEAPELVSTSPEDGAVGVDALAPIAFRFSEPMDRASVEAAFVSASLPVEAVAFSWNETGDELTVMVDDGLAYAEGDIDVAALAYDLSIGTTATDLAGNALAAPAETTFATLRHITHHVLPVPELVGYAYQGGSAAVGDLRVGDVILKDNSVAELRGFVTFDFTELPDDVTFESMTLRAPQLASFGDPDGLGALHAESIWYETLDVWAYLYAPETAGAALTFDGSQAPLWTADVMVPMLDDLANREARNNLSQFRLRYLGGADDDAVNDHVRLSAESMLVEVVYLAE